MIPKYNDFMLPILRLCEGGRSLHRAELDRALAEQHGLTSEERSRILPSGRQTYLESRIGWAVTYLKKAGLVSSEHKVVSITEAGLSVLRQNPGHIDRKFLMQIPQFREFYYKAKKDSRREDKPAQPGREEAAADGQDDPDDADVGSPEDMMACGYRIMRRNTEAELLERINRNSPQFFERMVSELVGEMGYGIKHQVLGRSGDGGIDGVITQDKLEFDKIYLQAKRWTGTVPIHHVRDFVGALEGHKSDKGIFITSSDFSNDAYEYVSTIGKKVILIDGSKLVEYMFDYGVGAAVKYNYAIKAVDEDYFAE